MNASRFQRENNLCTHRDSDSFHWTSVCLHNPLDNWNQNAVLYCRVCTNQVSQIRHQHHASSAKGKLEDDFYWHQAVINSNLLHKIKEVDLGIFPHFPESSPHFWKALPLLTQAPSGFHHSDQRHSTTYLISSSRPNLTLKCTKISFFLLTVQEISNKILFD